MSEDNSEFICYWRIENFLLRRSNSDLSLKSPSFAPSLLNSKWSLEFGQEKPGFIGLFLFKETNPIFFEVEYYFQVLTSRGWTTGSDLSSFTFEDGGNGEGEYNLISWQNISNEEWTWLPFGALTVCVHMRTNKTINKSAQCLIVSRMMNGSSNLKHLPIQYFDDLKPSVFLNLSPLYSIESSETEPRSLSEKNSVSTQTKEEMKTQSTQTKEEMKTQSTQTKEEFSLYEDRRDLLRFFKEKDFDFVTLRTINKDFTVHKAVLCAKSPVFNAMFERRMQENDSSLVNIHDVNGDTLAMLVRYLHFEPLDNLQWEDAANLFYAADKYQIEGLKVTCLIILKQGLSVKTVCDAFVMADLHQNVNLMQNAFEFFCEKSKFIFKSDEWKKFLRNKPDLASEVLEKLADKM